MGSDEAVPLDLRLIAATNKDLRQAMLAREFREDLYYRIATFKLRLLPLARDYLTRLTPHRKGHLSL